MDEALIADLQQLLRADIQRIHQSDGSEISQKAARRLELVAEHSPAFICLLAEPWIGADITDRTRGLMRDCARIHLYARILDDAVDEEGSVYRHNLLRAQPLFWEAVQNIGAAVPATVAGEAVRLIAETVSAVQIDDIERNPLYWGAKNHHLLLLPLLLSGNSPAYQACHRELSILIALVQAGDEWRQGEMNQTRLRSEFIKFLVDCLNTEKLAALSQSGWHASTERIVWNARQLFDVLCS